MLRKKCLFVCIFLSGMLLNINIQAQSELISIDTLPDYKGWGWEVMLLQNKWISLAVVPSIGGRIMAYDLEIDTFMITNPTQYGKTYYDGGSGPWASSWGYGGYKTWPAPQSKWNWPPPPTLAWGNYEYELIQSNSDSLTILLFGETETTRAPGLRFNRYITAYSHSTRIKIATVLFNDSDETQSWAVWDVTQAIVRHGKKTDYTNFSVYFPVTDEDKVWNNGQNVPSRGMDNPGIYKVNYTTNEGKIFADVSEGWALFVDELDQQSYAKTFELQPIESYPDGEAPVELYTNGSNKYLELEAVGPLCELASGDSCIYIENWYASAVSGPVYKVTSAGQVKEKLNYSAQSGKLTGEFGVYHSGSLKWSFFDENMVLISAGDNFLVDPSEMVTLNESVILPETTKYIKLSAYNSKGIFINDIDIWDAATQTGMPLIAYETISVKLVSKFENSGELAMRINTIEEQNLMVTIISPSGQILYPLTQINILPGTSEHSLNISALPKGFYLLKCVTESECKLIPFNIL